MRRAFFVLLVAALAATVVAAPVMARPAATQGAHASAAVQGEPLLVKAQVRHAVRGQPFSATAVATFDTPSGPVSQPLDLKRAGKSFIARAKVSVPADATGTATIEVTVSYGGTDTVFTLQRSVHSAGD